MKGSNRATVPFGTDFQTTTWKDHDAPSAPTHIIKKGTATFDLTLVSWNAQYERERERVMEPRNPLQGAKRGRVRAKELVSYTD